MEKDNIDDISKHGHQVAIQNVFIKQGKDFTFIKNQVAKNKFLNNENNIKGGVDLVYAYYSTLFPLTAPKEYTKENLLELKTLEFQYKRNVSFERKWKSSLANRMAGGSSSTPMGQNVGIIVNTEAMGMTAGQYFQQNQPAQAQAPQAQAPQTQAPPQPVENEKIAKGTSAVPTPDLKEKQIIPQVQNIKPVSNKKVKNKMKYQDVKLKVRSRMIKPNLLFTNPKVKETPPQPEGLLPSFKVRERRSNRRRL